MSFEPKIIRIAVALMMTDHGVAITWSENWDAFVLPMTKIATGARAENPEQAAVRALAEVLRVPCQIEPGQTSHEMRQLQLSDRDGEIKDYQFVIVPVRIHPDFANTTIRPHSVIFATGDKLQAGEYQPMSPSTKLIIDECASIGLV